MNWYEIATPAAGGVAVVAAYFGARLGAKHSIITTQHAREDEWSAEHARWMRDRRSDIYVDTIAVREFRAMLRSRTLRDIASDESELEAPSTASAGILFARMHLWGSKRAVKLLQEAFIAEQRCVNLHTKWRASATDGGTTPPPKHEIEEAMMAADIADESLISFLREEIQQPIASSPVDGNRAAWLDWPSVPEQASVVDASGRATAG